MSVGATRTLSTWDTFNNHVERILDNSAYSAAHPDDVLFVAGPPRKSQINEGATSGVGSLMPLGLIQVGSVSSQLGVNPSKAIGSSRKFFLVDSTMHQLQFGRVVMNSRNLLRALYHSAVEAGIDVGNRSVIGMEASYQGRDNQQWWINLDSPIYRLPVGIGIILRDRGGSSIGGFYCELCHITGWNLQIAQGQAAIVENVSLVCDRLMPFGNSNTIGALAELFDTALGIDGTTTDEKARAGSSDNLS